MLHALPALLDELERRLIAGEDPSPVVTNIRWPEIVSWPANREDALTLKRRVEGLQQLLNGLQAPLRAALSVMGDGGYRSQGAMPLPKTMSVYFQESV